MTSNPFKISTIDEINNKSVTVTLNGDFLGTEDFVVCKMSDPSQLIGIKAVEDSVNPAANKRVIVAKDVFEKGIGYTVKITRGNDEDSENFTVGDFTPPNYATVKTYGDRILKVEFTTPIDNLHEANHPDELDVPIPNTEYDELRNFYCVYNTLNTSASDSGHGLWVGVIKIWDEDDSNRPVDPTTVPNTIRIAPDFKSLEIQYNFKSIPIGANKIIVNYSHNQSQSFSTDRNLMDFADPPRQVPTLTLDFDIVKSDIAAKAINCKSLSRTEFVITYDKPVIVLDAYKVGCILVNGKGVIVKGITRVGNDFNKIKFELDVVSALPLNSANITVGPITDANGYQTDTANFNNVPVISTPPKIKSLIQIDPPDVKSTAILATWSEAMQYAPNAMQLGDVCDVKNYTLQDSNANIIPIKKLIYDITTNELIILTAKLDTGLYFFHAEKVNDVLGETMNPQDFSINIEDRTIPNVVEVVFRTDNGANAFVVKFDDVMSVSGEHSAAERSNYAVENIVIDLNPDPPNIPPSITTTVLDSNTRSFTMNKNKWIRFTLPDAFNVLPVLPPLPNVQYSLRIGYPLIKTIRYVEDASKNIYPLCKTQSFTPYSILNIKYGEKYIIADNQLLFKYVGNNEIYSVIQNDFTFVVHESDGSTPTVTPIAIKNDWETITFTFPQNTFDGNMTQVDMIMVANPSSVDIFGEPFIGYNQTTGDGINLDPVQNGLSPELKAVSLIDKDITNKTITLRFVFTKDLIIFNVEDFKVTLNSYPAPLTVSSIATNTPPSIFDVKFAVPYSTSLSDIFMVSLVDPNYILSKDSNGNPVAPFSNPMLVSKLIATTLSWVYTNPSTPINTTLIGDRLEITYNNPIDPYSVFAGWDGTSKALAPGTVIFDVDPSQPNRFMMNIGAPNSNNFGTVLFYPNTPPATPPFITALTSNTAPATITLVNQNKLVVQFDSITENAQVNANAITYVEYVGDVEICDADGKYYLYKAYRPTDVL